MIRLLIQQLINVPLINLAATTESVLSQKYVQVSQHAPLMELPLETDVLPKRPVALKINASQVPSVKILLLAHQKIMELLILLLTDVLLNSLVALTKFALLKVYVMLCLRLVQFLEPTF
jgi:hypothetical protein